MSYHAWFQLVVLPHAAIARHYPPRTATLLLGQPVAPYRRTQDDLDLAVRTIAASSRSDWFTQSCLRLLRDFPGYDSLRFLTREQVTHREFEPYDSPPEGEAVNEELGGTHLLYTLLQGPALAEAADQMRHLLDEMRARPERVAASIEDGYTGEDVAVAWQRARVCGRLNYEASEECDDIDGLLCGLVSMHEALALARQEGHVAIYTQTLPM
ncbi:MAG TPA: hypothetical protein VEY50_10925 [Lysobacter sp.]|nr:hypothetical protein [Lysobacter sp.]